MCCLIARSKRLRRLLERGPRRGSPGCRASARRAAPAGSPRRRAGPRGRAGGPRGRRRARSSTLHGKAMPPSLRSSDSELNVVPLRRAPFSTRPAHADLDRKAQRRAPLLVLDRRVRRDEAEQAGVGMALRAGGGDAHVGREPPPRRSDQATSMCEAVREHRGPRQRQHQRAVLVEPAHLDGAHAARAEAERDVRGGMAAVPGADARGSRRSALVLRRGGAVALAAAHRVDGALPSAEACFAAPSAPPAPGAPETSKPGRSTGPARQRRRPPRSCGRPGGRRAAGAGGRCRGAAGTAACRRGSAAGSSARRAARRPARAVPGPAPPGCGYIEQDQRALLVHALQLADRHEVVVAELDRDLVLAPGEGSRSLPSQRPSYLIGREHRKALALPTSSAVAGLGRSRQGRRLAPVSLEAPRQAASALPGPRTSERFGS